jgi:hypothetical protein
MLVIVNGNRAAGLPDFTWCNIPKWGKYTETGENYLYQIAIKYTKWPEN